MALLMTLPNKLESIMLEHIVATTETILKEVVAEPSIDPAEEEFKEVEVDYFVIHLADGTSRGVKGWKMNEFNNFVRQQVTMATAQPQIQLLK